MITHKMSHLHFDEFGKYLKKSKIKFLKAAMQVCVDDMVQGILHNKAIDGSGSFPKLEKFTIDKKGHDRPLQNELKLIKKGTYIKNVLVGKDQGEITLKDVRAQIGYDLQRAGIKSKSGLKFFRFFGISADAVLQIERLYKALVTAALASIK